MDTPLTDHLTNEDYHKIYEPAEDSFLLLDAIEADLFYLKKLNPCVCVEIGSGSGVIITALARKFKEMLCLATDINAHACRATKNTALHNGTFVDALHCNLNDALQDNCVDLLLFNPPYVVTNDEEIEARTETPNIVHAWAGGLDGRRIINELLLRLDKVLSVQGVLYLLLLRENKPKELVEQLKLLNFEAKIFMERRIPGEYLYVLKVKRQSYDV